MKTRANKGFTLIELMIVIAIIAVIAAIAIPNLLRSRMSANEAAAIGTIRTISSAQQQFQAAAIIPFPSGMGQYAASVAVLGAQAPPFVDSSLATSDRQGYNFASVGGGPDGAPLFTAIANPLAPGTSGGRAFYSDQSGVITFVNGAGPAGPGNAVLQ